MLQHEGWKPLMVLKRIFPHIYVDVRRMRLLGVRSHLETLAPSPDSKWSYQRASRYLSLPPTWQSWHQVIDLKADYNRDLWEGRGRSGTSRGSSPVGLCWSSAQLGNCRLSLSWTQIWLQAHNGVNDAAHSPDRSRGPYILKFAFVGQCPLASKPTVN